MVKIGFKYTHASIDIVHQPPQKNFYENIDLSNQKKIRTFKPKFLNTTFLLF